MRGALAHTSDPKLRKLLECMIEGGAPLVHELAARRGTTPSAFLGAAFAEATPLQRRQRLPRPRPDTLAAAPIGGALGGAPYPQLQRRCVPPAAWSKAT